MKNIILFFFLLFVESLYSQITLIPDPVFEQYLVIFGIDSDGEVNGQVFTSDIENRVSLEILGFPLITDLTGIEDFTSLENLGIGSVNITEIDLSNNLNLKSLDIVDVSLTSLDISNNTLLEFFDLELNYDGGFFTSPITAIDLSSNTLLKSAFFFNTLITEIDFSQNINLQGLELWSMDELTYVNLKNDNNININWLQMINNTSLECVQVDDPAAVIAGIDPPYDIWTIENNPIITDDCQLGVSDYSIEKSVSLYPNPVSSILTIENNPKLQIETINIYDVFGRLMIQEKEQFNTIDVSHLNNGLLFATIETAQGIITKKVVKE